jgi:GNAT superfamily N-acetyltransferase
MVTIQRLQPDEIERLRRIRLAALKDAPDAFGSTYQEAIAWPNDRWQQQLRQLPTFLAVVDGVDCGVVRSCPHPQQAHVAYLISMWVVPHVRRTGVGVVLIDAVIDWAKAEGCHQLLLDVCHHNPAAMTLYERQGFKPTGNTGHLPPPREHIQEFEMVLNL